MCFVALTGRSQQYLLQRCSSYMCVWESEEGEEMIEIHVAEWSSPARKRERRRATALLDEAVMWPAWRECRNVCLTAPRTGCDMLEADKWTAKTGQIYEATFDISGSERESASTFFASARIKITSLISAEQKPALFTSHYALAKYGSFLEGKLAIWIFDFWKPLWGVASFIKWIMRLNSFLFVTLSLKTCYT